MGGNLSLRTYPGSYYQHFGIACNITCNITCNINYQHYRNDDSNRRYVDSSTGGNNASNTRVTKSPFFYLFEKGRITDEVRIPVFALSRARCSTLCGWLVYFLVWRIKRAKIAFFCHSLRCIAICSQNHLLSNSRTRSGPALTVELLKRV